MVSPRSNHYVPSLLSILILMVIQSPCTGSSGAGPQLVLNTNCRDGALWDVDKFSIAGIINASQLNKMSQRFVRYWIKKENAENFTLECYTDLWQGCKGKALGCFCVHGGEQLALIYTQRVSGQYSRAVVNVSWESAELIQLPTFYDRKSEEIGYLQDFPVSNYSLPCFYPVLRNMLVTYCCRRTAIPCVASIVTGYSTLITQNRSCVIMKLPTVHMSLEGFTFHYQVCGAPGTVLSCTGYFAFTEESPKGNITSKVFVYLAIIIVCWTISALVFMIAHHINVKEHVDNDEFF